MNCIDQKQTTFKKKQKTVFADVNFWIGQNFLLSKYSIDDIKALEVISSGCLEKNISTFFISNFLSAAYSPLRGNDITAAFLNIKAPADIYGVLFFEQENFSKPKSFRNEMARRYRQGFRILRLLPKSHKYPYEAGLFNAFYDELNEMRFPVILNLDEIDVTGNKNIEWDKIYEICKRYQNIPFIIDGGASKELMYNSYLLSLLYNTSNVFIETHNLLGFNQIEDLAGFVGPQRIIFGSYFPHMAINISVSRLLNAGIVDSQKQAIAADNIKRIINDIKIEV